MPASIVEVRRLARLPDVKSLNKAGQRNLCGEKELAVQPSTAERRIFFRYFFGS